MDPTAAQRKPDCQQPSPGLPQGTRILVADDTGASRFLLAAVLGKAGAQVVAVDNGQAAVERVQEAVAQHCPFDAILLDMAMPVLDGYEAAQRLRADGYQGPIIALTAYVSDGEREKCLAVGCNDYLGKPIDRAGLVATLASHLPQASSRGQPPAKAGKAQPAKSLLESLPPPQRAKLLQDFVDSLIERVTDMEAALHTRDTATLTHRAHSIHGTAYLFDFPQIASLAGRIEHDLREGMALEQIEPAIVHLAQLCRNAAHA
jgi:CheY-like chemotaxis protein/HPt (histidine-containing phosphotransfer) domain-containing protein